ncbi:MAG: hypothetical protein JO040_10525, partial [Gemmatimonadetes bacterium]|nr:hypothetical protein [Gemmatimonadota bacterium]
GAVVAGRLVGEKAFFAAYGALQEQVWKPVNPLLGEQERTRWTEHGEKRQREVLDQLYKQFRPVEPEFIHLADARYVTGNGRVPAQAGMLWRGRLSEVGGFSVGTVA